MPINLLHFASELRSATAIELGNDHYIERSAYSVCVHYDSENYGRIKYIVVNWTVDKRDYVLIFNKSEMKLNEKVYTGDFNLEYL
ncbi:MAG: hypothetical protein ACTSUE_03855 [Promethearchaeota archaeon]